MKKTRANEFDPIWRVGIWWSLHSPTCHEPDYYHNHSDYQNNVDQTSGDMERESEKPQDE